MTTENMTEDPFDTPLPQVSASASAPKPRARRAKPEAQAPDTDPPFDVDPPEGQEPTQANQLEDATQQLGTIKRELSAYSKIDAGIAALQQKYKGVVFEVATADGMKDAETALKAIREPRFALERARKAAKAPILTIGRVIDGEAKRITALLLEMENPIEQQVTQQKAIEAERQAALQRRINWLTELPANLVGKDLESLELAVRDLEAMDMSTFAEREQEAFAILGPVMNQVIALRDQARQAEDERKQREQRETEARRVRAHNERIAKIEDFLNGAAMARTSSMLEKIREQVVVIQVGPDFEEFQTQAQRAKDKVLGTLERLIEDRKELEQLRADKVRAEQEAREKAEQEARDKAEAERKAQEAQAKPVEDAAPQTRVVVAPFSSGGRTYIHEPEQPAVDPFSTPTTFGTMPEAPSAEDIVRHLADHYDDGELNVIAWLEAMDFDALRAQFRQPTTTESR